MKNKRINREQHMNFKKFLLESNRSITIDEKDFIENIADYSQAIERYLDDCKIYRGLSNTSVNILSLTPSKFNRVSAATKNYVTLLVDNMKEWKEYPKRSKSAICTSNLHTALSYGNAYIVLPKNGASIGVCGSSDWWDSFGETTIDELNDIIDDALAKVNKNNFKTENNITVLKQALSEYDDGNFKNPDIDKFRGKLSFSDAIEKYLDPKKYNFKIVNISNYNIKSGNFKNDYEVWTSSDCILIQEMTLINILAEQGFYK